MGGAPSAVQVIDLPSGCSTYFITPNIDYYAIDCDCRAVGFCPAGPPPPPPIWEFLDIKPNEVVPNPRPKATIIPYPEAWEFDGDQTWSTDRYGKNRDDWHGRPQQPKPSGKGGPKARRAGERGLVTDSADLYDEVPAGTEEFLPRNYGGSKSVENDTVVVKVTRT